MSFSYTHFFGFWMFFISLCWLFQWNVWGYTWKKGLIYWSTVSDECLKCFSCYLIIISSSQTDRKGNERGEKKKKSDMISCSVWLHLDHYCSDRLGCWSKWCSFNEGVLQVKIIYILTFILHPALLWASTSHHKRAWNMQSYKVKNAKPGSSWKIGKKFCDVSLKCLATALNPDRILPGPNTVHVENFSIWELNLQVRLGWVCSDLW